MRTRPLGRSGLELTTIGLGTWAMGGGDWSASWGPQDDNESIAAAHRALDLGINWIDTAAAYGLGHAEEIVGRALEGRRDGVIVATKCGLVWDEGKREVYGRLEADSVRREIEASLRRLRVETIDLYQVHWPDPESDIEEAWEVIAEAVRAGKIRHAGVSNFNEEQIRRVARIHPVASLQPPYSMLRRGIEESLLGFCRDNGIGVVVYSPMQAGLLTGKMTRERVENFPADDWRRKSRFFQEPHLSANLEVAEGLRTIASREGRTPAQLAVAWTLRRPEVTSAIVGARRPSQIEGTAPAGDWDLSEETADSMASKIRDEVGALLAERDRRLG